MKESTSAGEDMPALHVLVVDDDGEQRNIVIDLLKTIACRVDVAADGASAVRQFTRLQPDVILMDLGMPTIDGWDAIRRIRQLASSKRPHIVVVSAFADARSRQRAFEVGANEYLVKPVDVRGTIHSYVARRGNHRLSPMS